MLGSRRRAHLEVDGRPAEAGEVFVRFACVFSPLAREKLGERKHPGIEVDSVSAIPRVSVRSTSRWTPR